MVMAVQNLWFTGGVSGFLWCDARSYCSQMPSWRLGVSWVAVKALEVDCYNEETLFLCKIAPYNDRLVQVP